MPATICQAGMSPAMTRTGSTIAAVGGMKLRICASPPVGSLTAWKDRKYVANRTTWIGVVTFWISSWRGTSAPATANIAA